MSQTVLILGGQGMLGHQLWREALSQGHQAWATVRRRSGVLVAPEQALPLSEVSDFDALMPIMARVRPDVVVNCVGVVKQLAAAKDAVPSVTLNSLLPHRLSQLCEATGARFIHISTDCVFSGRKGLYTEQDIPDAEDLYGRSKVLGEVSAPGLTLRTSIIGRELTGAHGLVEWFLGQQGTLSGYRKAVFSGVTTRELSRVILRVAGATERLEGLYHVAAKPIDKFTLLQKVAAAFGRSVTLQPVDAPAIDRSLDGSRFSRATGWTAPSWDSMIREMAEDEAQYVGWRHS